MFKINFDLEDVIRIMYLYGYNNWEIIVFMWVYNLIYSIRIRVFIEMRVLNRIIMVKWGLL